MLLRGVRQGHPHDDVVTFRESHILVGEVVVGLGERRGGYVRGTATEHKTKEPLGCFVDVAGKCQTFIERGVGGPEDYRMAIHMVLPRRWLYPSYQRLLICTFRQ